MKHTFLICMFFLFIAPLVCATNLVFNGDLELPGFSIPAYYRYLYNGDSTTIQGWTISDDGIGEASYIMHRTGYSGVYEGNYSLSLNQGSSIRTTFATVANTNYRLSFYTALSSNPMATPMKVKIGTNVATFSQSGTQTYDFTASTTNASTLLEFINDAPTGDFKIHLLDSISIVQVPEASSVFFLLLGSTFSLYFLRKKF